MSRLRCDLPPGTQVGREYHNPICVFRRHDGYVVALTYGSHTDWVRNVLASGGCDLITRGRRHHLVEPRLCVDTSGHSGIPQPFRTVLMTARVTEYLELHRPPTEDPR